MPKSRRKIVKIAALVMVIMMVLSLIVPFVSNAEGTTSISLSQRNPKVGDSFTATVTASQSAEMKISYDSRVITLVGTTVDGPQTSNSITVNAQSITLTFQAKAEGTSGVIVESSALTGSSVNVPVASSQPAPVPEPAPTPTPTPSQTTTDDTETVDRENEVSQDELVLSSSSEISITVEEPSVLPSSRMVLSTLTVNEKQIPAYVLSGATSEYYYIYGKDTESAYGWFIYDEINGDIFPADQSALSLIDSLDNKILSGTTQEVEGSNDKKGFELPFEITPQLIMILAGAFVALIILILIVNAIAKSGNRRRRYSYDKDFEYIDDDEEDDEEEDNPVNTTATQVVDTATKARKVDAATAVEEPIFTPTIPEVTAGYEQENMIPNQYQFTYSPEENAIYAPKAQGMYAPEIKETYVEEQPVTYYSPDELSGEAFSAPQYQLTPREEMEPTREEVSDELIDDIIKHVNINDDTDFDSDLEDLDDF